MANKHQVLALHARDPLLTARKMAELLECSEGYVLATAKRERISLGKSPRGRHGPRPKERKFDHKKAASLRKKGLSHKAIGQRLGVHEESVRMALI